MVVCCAFSGMIVAMVVSLVFLLLLRYLAFVLVWVLILGVLAMGGYGKCDATKLQT